MIDRAFRWAKRTGSDYGRTVGYRAAGFDAAFELDPLTRAHHARSGIDADTLALADAFSERAFWTARAEAAKAA